MEHLAVKEPDVSWRHMEVRGAKHVKMLDIYDM